MPRRASLLGERLAERAQIRDALEVGHLVARLLGVAAVGEEDTGSCPVTSTWPLDPVKPVR